MQQDGAQDHTGHTSANRTTTYGAAEILGLAKNAVEKRIQKGSTLPYEHRSRRDDLIESLRQDQITFLRNELAARNEELHRRENYWEENHHKGQVIAAAPVSLEALRAPDTATMSPGRANGTSGHPRASQTSARRPWCKKMCD
jgi:hypothetical protein